MLSRVLDFFKRDKAKKEFIGTSPIPTPPPSDRPKPKVRRSWISRWVKNRKDRQRAKQIIARKEVSHVAHPHHVIKPLRPIQPQRFFYSTRGIK